MNKRLQQQIQGMIDYDVSYFLDAYQCDDWGITATEFAELLIKEFTNTILQVANELDNDPSEDEDEDM